MNKIVALCALGSVALLAGCGGSDGNSSTTASGRATRTAVYLTDSFREEFGHVWATIYHVELIPQDGSAAVVVYDNPDGIQIDLKTLRDASGNRYSFLSNAAIPSGTYTGLHISVGPTMQLIRNGEAVGDPIAVDSSIPLDTAGHPQLSLTFRSPKTIGGTTNTVIIDFDLARFVVRTSGVLPALQEGTGDKLHDPAQHEAGQYHGVVSNLTGTAPTLTFTLTDRTGATTTVVTSASTALYGNSGSLQNGSHVEITGTLDPNTQNLVATQIEVGGNATAPRPRVAGAASAIDATTGTFQVTPRGVRGMLPNAVTIKVITNASTVYYSDAGAVVTPTDFFAALASTPTVAVTGAVDATTNTITAVSAKVIDHTHDGGWEQGPHPIRGNGQDWGNGHFHPNH